MRMQQIQTLYPTTAIVPQRMKILLSSSSSNGYFSMTEALIDCKTSRKSKENWESVTSNLDKIVLI